MTATFIILGILWFVSGAWSFIYWWTKDYDFTTSVSDIAALILSGLCGPFTFIVGRVIQGDYQWREGRTVFKKMQKK